MKLVKFADAEQKVAVYINPEMVREVRTSRDGGTAIEYENGHKILVAEKLEEVVRGLMDA